MSPRLRRLLDAALRARGPIVAIAGVGAVLSGFVGYYTTWRTVTGTAMATAPPEVRAGTPSIVVLPFSNHSGDPQKGYIADALTSSITADLGRIREAVVIGALTAFSYKDKAVPLPQLGRELGVRFALQGSVQADGPHLRVNAQLADAQSGALLWAESFDGESTQLFALQDQVTRRIANSIGRQIVVIAARESDPKPANARVSDLMLRFAALRMAPRTWSGVNEAELLLRKVLALEPRNAEALAWLSRVLWTQAVNFEDRLPPAEAQAKKSAAYELAFRARDLDPNIAVTYFSLARHAGDSGDQAGRLSYLEKAIALDPRSTEGLVNMSVMQIDLFEPEKAMEYAQQAIRFDPRSPGIYVAMRSVATAHLFRGNYPEAVAWARKSLAENPPDPGWTFGILVAAYACMGDASHAQEGIAQARQSLPAFTFSSHLAPGPNDGPAYRGFYANTLLPAAIAVGLPL